MRISLRKEEGRTSRPCRAAFRARRGLLFALLGTTLVLMQPGPARAEEPLWGEIAETLGRGFLTVTTRGGYAETRPFRHHGGSVLLTTTRMDATTSVQYGLTPDMDLHLRIPYLSAEVDETFAGQTAHHQLSGLGEMEVGAKWRFWQAMNSRHKNELALMLDLKLPTGDPNMTDDHGAIMPPHLQPNSGNPGLMLGLALDRHTNGGAYWLSVMGSTEAASNRYQRGNMIELHASTGRRLRPLTRANQTDWMGIFGLHYHVMGQESEGGSPVRDSGGSGLAAEFGIATTRSAVGARIGILLPLTSNYGLAHPPPGKAIQASIRGSF